LESAFDLAALRAAFVFKRFLKQQRIQIVHTFFESSDIWAGLVTKTMSKAKLVWARRDMGIMRSRKHHIAYRLMAGAPDAVFTVSEQVRRHAIEVDRIDAARVQTIYNGLNLADWDAVPRVAKNPGEFLVTTVGNIRRVKGHDVFIRAAATIVQQFPKVSFSIAGDVVEPACLTELQALVQDLDLVNHVRFDGAVTDLRRHLTAADIFVLPSRSEGFSNAIIEAMASSLPVVATDVGGNAEAVKDGITGFLVPSEDPDALSAAILRLLCDPLQAKAMGSAGRNLVEERFTIEAMMNQVAGAYRKLLSGR
jgi:glycosyltransferase involved in cell wall biosynthesis